MEMDDQSGCWAGILPHGTGLFPAGAVVVVKRNAMDTWFWDLDSPGSAEMYKSLTSRKSKFGACVQCSEGVIFSREL